MQLHRDDSMPHATAAMPRGCQQYVNECIGKCLYVGRVPPCNKARTTLAGNVTLSKTLLLQRC